jgi:hypothetical protein
MEGLRKNKKNMRFEPMTSDQEEEIQLDYEVQ